MLSGNRGENSYCFTQECSPERRALLTPEQCSGFCIEQREEHQPADRQASRNAAAGYCFGRKSWSGNIDSLGSWMTIGVCSAAWWQALQASVKCP